MAVSPKVKTAMVACRPPPGTTWLPREAIPRHAPRRPRSSAPPRSPTRTRAGVRAVPRAADLARAAPSVWIWPSAASPSSSQPPSSGCCDDRLSPPILLEWADDQYTAGTSADIGAAPEPLSGRLAAAVVSRDHGRKRRLGSGLRRQLEIAIRAAVEREPTLSDLAGQLRNTLDVATERGSLATALRALLSAELSGKAQKRALRQAVNLVRAGSERVEPASIAEAMDLDRLRRRAAMRAVDGLGEVLRPLGAVEDLRVRPSESLFKC